MTACLPNDTLHMTPTSGVAIRFAKLAVGPFGSSAESDAANHSKASNEVSLFSKLHDDRAYNNNNKTSKNQI